MSEFLRILAPSVNVDLKVLMGAGAATPTGGIGGWTQEERPDAKNLTEWKGNSTVTQDIPILINGFMDGNNVQGQANDIIALGRNPEDDEVPPVFRMFGAIWFPWFAWVLEGISWGEEPGDEVIRDTDTTLLRQELTLHVAEFEDPDQIRIKRIRHAFGVGKGGGVNAPGNIYIVHKGDTIASIAAKVYGDRSVWKVLAKKNGIRDPNAELKPGREIKLPANPWANNG
jgi:phage tail protein X